MKLCSTDKRHADHWLCPHRCQQERATFPTPNLHRPEINTGGCKVLNSHSSQDFKMLLINPNVLFSSIFYPANSNNLHSIPLSSLWLSVFFLPLSQSSHLGLWDSHSINWKTHILCCQSCHLTLSQRRRSLVPYNLLKKRILFLPIPQT